MYKQKTPTMLFNKKILFCSIYIFAFILSCTKNKEYYNISLNEIDQLRSIEIQVKEITKETNETAAIRFLDSLNIVNEYKNKPTTKHYIELLLTNLNPNYKPQEKITLINELSSKYPSLESCPFSLHKKSTAIANQLRIQEKYKLATEELMNSLQYIEDNPDFYYHEIAFTYLRIAYIASAFTKEYKKSFESNKRAIEIFIKHDNSKQTSSALYNNGITSIHSKNYTQAKACFNSGIDYSMKSNNYDDILHLHYVGLILAHSKSQEIDSMDAVLAKGIALYESKKVSEKLYYEFLIQATESYAIIGEYDLLRNKFKSIEEFFKDCKDPHTLQLIYNSKIQLEKLEGSPQNIKKYLLLKLENLKKLQPAGVHRTTATKETLEQLIEFAIKEKDYKNLQKWHQQKDKIQDRWIALADDRNEVFKIQTDLWADKDLEYTKKEVNLQKEKIKNTRIILSILFIFSCILLYLLYKVNSFTKILKSKNKKLEDKNDIINQQNQKLNELLIQLENSNSQLKNSNEALNTSLTNLAEANRSLENFAQIAAHDIKAPLRTINSFTQIIKKRYYNSIAEKDRSLFDFVTSGTSKLSDLVTGLLQFSSLTHSLPKEKNINLNNTVLLIKNQLTFNSEENNASINIIGELPTIKSHPTLIQQLLLNIINNSVKYSKRDEHNFIEVSHQKHDDNFIRISVKDNGIGIAKQQQPEIFDFLRKLHDSSEYEGNGIGLATCKKVTEYLGGDIWVESELGEGTTISFTLPNINPSISG